MAQTEMLIAEDDNEVVELAQPDPDLPELRYQARHRQDRVASTRLRRVRFGWRRQVLAADLAACPT
jgi:hypothetical protein